MCPRSPLTSQMVPPEVPKRPQNVQFWDLMELCGSPQRAFFGIWRLRSNVGQALLCSTFIFYVSGVLLDLLLKALRRYFGSFGGLPGLHICFLFYFREHKTNVEQALLCSTFISNEFGVLLELLLKFLRAYLGSFGSLSDLGWRDVAKRL